MSQPYVILDTGMSLNGIFINDKHYVNQLNEYRKQELRGRVDAIVVSSADIKLRDYEYKVKTSIMKQPELVILDKHCQTPPDSLALSDEKKKVIMVISKSASPSRVREIRKAREDVEIITIGEHTINLEKTLWALYERGAHKILVEGDPKLNTRLIRERLVDEVYVMIYPVLVEGGKVAIGAKIEGDKTLMIEGILQYGDHAVLHYKVNTPR
ncbi:RibD family protein [Candidatus Altiarchaeota archaeon]